MSNTRSPNKPWLSRSVPLKFPGIPGRPTRRVRKNNLRAFWVLQGKVKNGLAACPRCGTVEQGHTLTDSLCGSGKND